MKYYMVLVNNNDYTKTKTFHKAKDYVRRNKGIMILYLSQKKDFRHASFVRLMVVVMKIVIVIKMCG